MVRQFTAYLICVVFQVTFTVNITICYVYLNTVAFRQNRITYFWATMSTAANNHQKRYVCCLHTKLNIRKTFSCCVATMNAPQLTEFTASTMSANDATTLNCGKRLRIVLIVCQWRRSSTRRYSAVTVVRIVARWRHIHFCPCRLR